MMVILHWLFLDHDIIFYFKTTLKIFKKILSKVLNTFENIMKIEHLLFWSKCSIFQYIFKYMTFQRRQKVLLWSKGLIETEMSPMSKCMVCCREMRNVRRRKRFSY